MKKDMSYFNKVAKLVNNGIDIPITELIQFGNDELEEIKLACEEYVEEILNELEIDIDEVEIDYVYEVKAIIKSSIKNLNI